jgi:hypothetical protein
VGRPFVAGATAVAAWVLASTLLVPLATAAAPGALAPDATRPAAEPPLPRVPVANPGVSNNSSLNNTSNRIGGAITSFVDWFARGLGIVVALVIGILIVGGIANYVIVGRKRGEWTPAEVPRVSSPGPAPSRPEAEGPPPGPRPP